MVTDRVLDTARPTPRLGSMSTPITPIKAPALADLRNALQLAVTYGDKGVADSDAKQALDRIRGLIAQAIGKLGEPNRAAITAATVMIHDAEDMSGEEVGTEFYERLARDAAAAILHGAVTGEVAGSSFTDALSCPVCEGAGRIGSIPCDQCKGAGKL